MRIESGIKRPGQFWLPESPEEKYAGILTISDGGEIGLEITSNKPPLTNFDTIKVGRIIGELEKEGPVTLEGGFFKTKNLSFGAPATSTLRIQKAFFGMTCDSQEQNLFTNFSFHLDGLDEWLSVTGIKVDYSEDYKKATITYEPLQQIEATLETGENINIGFIHTLPTARSTTEAKITQKAYFSISSEKPEPIEHFIKITYRVVSLLCFATAQTLSIRDAEATLSEISCDNGIPFSVKVYYQSLPFSKKDSKTRTPEGLFSYKIIAHRWEEILKKWFNLHETISPALNLYFSTKNGTHKYLDSRFLSLAQGAETLSRRTNSEQLMDDNIFQELQKSLLTACPQEHKKWLEGRLMYGNEISLSKRLQALTKPFAEKLGSSKEIKSIVRRIVETRNYLTHYDDTKKETMTDPLKLWELCQKLESIIELNILSLLNFDSESIDLICKPPSALHRKLNETQTFR
ncbi:HEPN domain-containing protein [Pseudomonas sp. KCJK8993]|uniref:ApeA N-terminal domain 1-containing protein n=1 Tax=Pseudomonas sp. KCJK8993 TaxID=3344565 RepID=UPI0039062961